jgi:hypothetical protein
MVKSNLLIIYLNEYFERTINKGETLKFTYKVCTYFFVILVVFFIHDNFNYSDLKFFEVVIYLSE